ncbi:hypothetical protein GCM10010329_80430 [Streptomyces spiroverticillatus]|uniref:Uncharacterized protein n=1 Tax=Streptomyces finlayi TaxID=67296 RepID=A0A918X7H4_9ACTN|nr:hypothetical protein [Streptomyces finlayi]GHA45817.1 hypothetical protein GCM10010329_80430 [Streptomyces spiroverticillatus]GHD15875.1 hypothetical protein GCM10010334_76350 [Streptomyces finlayi]
MTEQLSPYEQYPHSYAALAATHQGHPTATVVALLRRAAERALLEFPERDLYDQARAITTGTAYRLRIAPWTHA